MDTYTHVIPPLQEHAADEVDAALTAALERVKRRPRKRAPRFAIGWQSGSATAFRPIRGRLTGDCGCALH